MIRFFWRFLREKEKTRVFAEDSQTEARRKSFQEKGKIGANVNKTAMQICEQNGLKNCIKQHFF
jgi:hypothetical protein